MARYDYRCEKCEDVHEEVHAMSETPRIRCPQCGGKCSRMIVDVAVRVPADWSWTGENRGRGKYISGLGKRSDPDAYCKTLREAEDKAKAKNLNYERH